IQLLLVLTSFSGRPGEPTPITLYAAKGRLIPFNSNSPTGSTVTAFSTFVSTNEDLLWLSLIAQPRGHVRDPTNRGVVEAPLETGGLTVRTERLFGFTGTTGGAPGSSTVLT